MGKKKGKGKKNKGPNKDPKITVAEYLLDCGTQKKLRLLDNADDWENDNRQLQTQVDSLRWELEVTIGYLRRQEGTERRLCEEEVAARDGELSEAEAQLRHEQRHYERTEFALSQELRDLMVDAADTDQQVDFWKNYPHTQNLEKQEKIKCLKSGIRQIDELHDAFEVQLDGNFRYMQSYLVSGHAQRLERAKRSAAGRALRRVSLSDHSDLAAQPALCLQSVIGRQQAETLRDQLDWIDGDNSLLQRSLAPLRRPDPQLPPGSAAASISSGDGGPEPAGGTPLRLHVESITRLLCTGRPSSAERALIDHVRDTTLERLRPDEDEQRARALAKLARPAASEHGGSVGSRSGESRSGSDVSRLSADQLMPFETPIQVPAAVRRQALLPFESWARQRHWWRVQAPRPRARHWPVTGPHLALYVQQPPVFDLAGPKVINESPSVSSAHISDEWELSKGGWQEHLRRRSLVSAGSWPGSASTDGPPTSGASRSSGGTSSRVRSTGRGAGTAPADGDGGGQRDSSRHSGGEEAGSLGARTKASKRSTAVSPSMTITKRASLKAIATNS